MKDIKVIAAGVEKRTEEIFCTLKPVEYANHCKVLNAFREARVSSYHLRGSTGYGYDDDGRDTLERVFAKVLGTEDALVRGQIVSGTHAIALCLFGVLKSGDTLLTVQGKPYDTLEEIIGVDNAAQGSLISMGVRYRQIELMPGDELNWQAIDEALRKPVKMVMLQRSCGYSIRPSLNMAQLDKLCRFIKERQPGTVIFVDNCYGEFVEQSEPTEHGADLIAGSLIKNPGGGLAPTGGYVAGRRQLVQLAARRLTAPGIGSDVGPTLGWQRQFYQGFYIAPHTVMEALRGAIWGACLFQELGYDVYPTPEMPRTDIIQAIVLGSADRLQAFCRGVQSASPVDSHVAPVPSPMPGYNYPVIMAAGTFVQGASLEFTADAPLREPYVVFFQGGLSLNYTQIGLIKAAEEILRR
ncbi:aminotransferase class I/II-fold pyridoxal phosphate-dependent enzyme [Desulfoscipio gibsoniae]|uniref:Cystathionine beta-lyase family protein involved in aluminum resistance n=1 Tax=Desulfoscipio gibsoniae DSM 7213 TaxID=767817 RepID=R4KDZ2_9FIRM|nr:aminotransferase class I/II-fold pyridoxal phosphate-dependent enzyme [Desulfoscipio gibsoniae]AGL01393.1 cystathionine beta-lyase family protein involved in aluminum resistance [Desulfoscipio gibsoniae DSM 7213]